MAKKSHIAIIATMRTGSNLLERILIQHPQLVSAGEVFNSHFVGNLNVTEHLGFDIPTRDLEPVAMLDAIATNDQPFTPIFRYFNDHTPSAFDPIISNPEIGKIVLHRNVMHSFISREAALHTNNWILGRRADETKPSSFPVSIEDYQSWANTTRGFYRRVETQLTETNQTAYYLDYDNIKNLDVLNEILVHFEIEPKMQYFFVPVQKQLRADPLAHVKNKDELLAAARDLPAPTVRTRPAQQPAIDEIHLAENLGLAYFPIYASAERSDLANLADANGDELKKISIADFKSKNFRSASNVELFTRVIEPEMRLAEIFSRLLFEEHDALGQTLDAFIGEPGEFPKRLGYPDRPRVLRQRFDFGSGDLRRGLRKFGISLRKELWGGKRRFVKSDLLWPQAMLIENANLGDALTVLVGRSYPETKIFDPLASKAADRSYSNLPFNDSVFSGKFDQIIFDLYREDLEAYFNEA